MLALFRGIGGATSLHRNPAHTIVIETGRTGVIPAGAPHRLDTRGPLLLAFLESRRFSVASAHGVVRRWAGATPESDLDCLLEDLARIPDRAVDRRAVRAVEIYVAGAALPEVAGQLGLSLSRLTHLVTDELGAPSRTWRSWLRLRDGVDQLAAGGSATRAAHDAGFADSAHFTRVCRAALGIPPSALRRVSLDGLAARGACTRVAPPAHGPHARRGHAR